MAAVEFNYSPLKQSSGLVGYWKLEDVNDSKGSNTFTNTGTVAFNAAKFNNGADTGASNSSKYLHVSNNLGIDGGNITIVGWFKQSGSAGEAAIVQQTSANNHVYNAIFTNWSGTTNRLAFARGRYNTATDALLVDQDLGTSVFHQLAMTYDGTNIRGYIDGSLVGTPTASSGNGASGGSDSFNIGQYISSSGAGGDWWGGIADDVAVFSRALTNTEIANLYNGGWNSSMLLMFK